MMNKIAPQRASRPSQRIEADQTMASLMPPPLELSANSAATPDASPHRKQTEESDEKEQPTLAQLNQALDGETEDVMTENSLPLSLGQLPQNVLRVFYFGGARFKVIDVGGDPKARSRTVLLRAIHFLETNDHYQYAGNAPIKTIHLYVGDYKSMQAYAKANPQLPYAIWVESLKDQQFSGKAYPDPDKNGSYYRAGTMGKAFVPTMYDRSKPFEEQKAHRAAFLDLSQIDNFGVSASDLSLKQRIDMALIIAHEGTHTMTRDASHDDSGKTHLMSDGGPFKKLKKMSMVTDPKTGKKKLDLHKYHTEALKILYTFGDKYGKGL